MSPFGLQADGRHSSGATAASGSHRTIRIDAETLEAHRERQVAAREHAGDACADQDPIFCDELGSPITLSG